MAKPRYHILAVEGISGGQRPRRRVTRMPHIDLPPTRIDDPHQARAGVEVAPRLDAHGRSVLVVRHDLDGQIGREGDRLIRVDEGQ